MEIILTHKIKLDPDRAQTEYFCKACGIARFAWNWGLSEWKKQYEAGLKPSGLSLKKEFNALKEKEFPWTYEVTKYACQQPFIYLQKAFVNFFNGTAQYPQFKKKGVHDSFYVGNDHFDIDGRKIGFPKLGRVKMREYLRFAGEIISATVSRTAGMRFASVSVRINHTPAVSESRAVAGVDLGVKNLATVSTGETVGGPKAYRKLQKKLAELQRSLSRKVRGSKNREKAKRKAARLHYRISCMRQDALHKLTAGLTENYSTVVIEDLNVRGMTGNEKLSKAVSDMGFYEFGRQLEYKMKMSGGKLIIADRWFPSTKKCSVCGNINAGITLSDRIFVCPSCGAEIDRDFNAALNLKALAA
jgi:putative transposase